MSNIMAIDIGGTNTRFAIVDEGMNVHDKTTFKTNAQDPQSTIDEIVSFIQRSKYKVSSIGISFPGPLDTGKGLVLTPPNLPGWHYYPITKILTEATELKCVLEGDARCAGLAEAVIGAASGKRTVFYITVSTGVGASIVQNERVVVGENGFAGEIANSVLWENGPKYGELHAGAIEYIASGPGLLKRSQELGLSIVETRDLFLAYKYLNPIAIKVINELIEYLSNYLAIVQTLIDPSMIVLGGSVITNNEWLIEKIADSIRSKVYPDFRMAINVKVSKNKDDAGLLGAAVLAQRLL